MIVALFGRDFAKLMIHIQLLQPYQLQLVAVNINNTMNYNYILILLALALACYSQSLNCSKGCQYCSVDKRKCSACSNGFELNVQGICFPVNLTNNCALLSLNLSSCINCKPTFRVQNGSCVKDFSGCLSYSGKSCLKCGYGTFLQNGNCTGILNCRNYNQTCQQCEHNHFFSSNQCQYVGESCFRVDNKTGACVVCKLGYNLVGYQCINSTLVVENCYLYDQKGCSYCKSGYVLLNTSCIVLPTCNSSSYMNAQYVCTSLPDSCTTVDNTTFLCVKCFPNYELTNSTCTPVLPSKCSQINKTGQCVNCSIRYFSFNYTCKEVSKFCKNYTNLGRCSTCTIAYFGLYQGTCKDPFCANSTEDQCITCKQNYIISVDTGQCILIDPNCINLQQTKCLECIDGYYISLDICLPLPSYCLSATKVGACTLCEINTYMQFNRCFPINKTIDNCRIYSQISVAPICLVCEIGYVISLGKCMLVPPYCNLLLTNGKCVTCKAGYYLSASGCVPNIPKLVDPNCLNYTGQQCVRCSSSSVLGINGVCYSKDDTKCSAFQTSGYCSNCLNGFILSQGICLVLNLIDVNCKRYGNSICLQCYLGYYLSQNQCKLPSSNCKSFNMTDGGCLSCYPGFTLTNQQCVILSKQPNCVAYDGSGNCLQCARMFYIRNYTCLPVNTLCQSYNAFTGACTSCYGGFAISGATCVKKNGGSYSNVTNMTAVCKMMRGTTCIQCPYRYYLRNNICNLVSLSCETYRPANGMCITCKIGYFMSSNLCVSYNSLQGADPNCKQFLSEIQCIQCYNGFILSDGKCISIDPLCKTANLTTGQCTSCYEGYSLINGKCMMAGGQVATLNTCVSNDTKGECTKCIPGYSLNTGKCIYNETGTTSNFNIPFCRIAVNGSYCTLCSDGFYAINGNCYQVSSYCQTYNAENGQCITCKDSYIFQNGACIFPAMGIDPYCQTYSSVYCSKCVSGYYLKDYTCQKVHPHCLSFNFEINQCTQCVSGEPNFDSCP